MSCTDEMLTESGLNDLITAVYLPVAAWKAGKSLLGHSGPLKLETLRPLFFRAPHHSWHRSLERQGEGGMLPAVFRLATKLVTVWTWELVHPY